MSRGQAARVPISEFKSTHQMMSGLATNLYSWSPSVFQFLGDSVGFVGENFIPNLTLNNKSSVWTTVKAGAILKTLSLYTPFGASQFITYAAYESWAQTYLFMFGMQVFWIIIFGVIIFWVQKRAFSKLSVNGG